MQIMSARDDHPVPKVDLHVGQATPKDTKSSGKPEPVLPPHLINAEKRPKPVRPSEPQVFVIIRRKKVTHYMHFGESSTFQDVKNEIEKSTQIPSQHQAIYFSMNGELMSSSLTLYQSGFPGVRHPPTRPAVFYVSFRQPDGKFEAVEVTEYLSPPMDGPHVIEGPGSSATVFPLADYAQKLLQQMAIKHNIQK